MSATKKNFSSFENEEVRAKGLHERVNGKLDHQKINLLMDMLINYEEERKARYRHEGRKYMKLITIYGRCRLDLEIRGPSYPNYCLSIMLMS